MTMLFEKRRFFSRSEGARNLVCPGPIMVINEFHTTKTQNDSLTLLWCLKETGKFTTLDHSGVALRRNIMLSNISTRKRYSIPQALEDVTTDDFFELSRIFFMARKHQKTVEFFQKLVWIGLCTSFWDSNLILDKRKLNQVPHSSDWPLTAFLFILHWLVVQCRTLSLWPTTACSTEINQFKLFQRFSSSWCVNYLGN